MIKLANGISFASLDNTTILDSALQTGIYLQHSCRSGRCGVCKAKVLEGMTQVLQPEESLDDQELADGLILTCCRLAKSNLEIDIEDLGLLADYPAKTMPCRIKSISPLNKNVLEISLRTPPSSSLHYLPGQYIDVIAKGGLRRSYSVANAPLDNGNITLHISRVEAGVMSKYWFENAKENDLLRLEGPLGTFFHRDSKAHNLILLATGTGIAPIKAILEGLACSEGGKHYNQIFLYWGGRNISDLYWRPQFGTLPIKFIPVLSRENYALSFKGYVQDAVLKNNHDLSNSVVYACGSQAMIRAAQQDLIMAGLNKKNFYSDAFVSSS